MKQVSVKRLDGAGTRVSVGAEIVPSRTPKDDAVAKGQAMRQFQALHNLVKVQ